MLVKVVVHHDSCSNAPMRKIHLFLYRELHIGKEIAHKNAKYDAQSTPKV